MKKNRTENVEKAEIGTTSFNKSRPTGQSVPTGRSVSLRPQIMAESRLLPMRCRRQANCLIFKWSSTGRSVSLRPQIMAESRLLPMRCRRQANCLILKWSNFQIPPQAFFVAFLGLANAAK